jgi:ubiquinone/menaquinone biosynthesis C-methylase UbiE
MWILSACRSDVHDNASMINLPSNATTVVLPSKTIEYTDRAIWQKPNLVIEKLGDISSSLVADIGAGSGYFSFRLAQKANKVIAIDIEKEALRYIDSVKQTLEQSVGNKIVTRLALPDNPKLKNEEVDIIVIINTIGYIDDIPAYLAKLKDALKPKGRIMIIDYKMKRLPINAPSKEFRVYLDKLEDILTNAGFQLDESDDTSLDYQYILIAHK